MPKADKRAKLAQLAALRKAGKKTFDSYEVERVEELYEEVDEDRYKKIVRQRLNQDDFVVDDNGEGYADDGREDWDRVQQYESDSEDGFPVRGKESKKCECLLLSCTMDSASDIWVTAKKQREEDQSKRDATDRDISEFFTKGAAKAPPKPKVCKISNAPRLGDMFF
jgi:DNA polymerase alpha subunit A